MSLANLLRQPLTIQKIGAGTDEYGNTIPTTLSAPVAVLGYLEQLDSIETILDRDTVVSSFRAWFPTGTNVTALDRVNYGSQTFEVDGSPWVVFNPRTGETSHLVTKLKVVG